MTTDHGTSGPSLPVEWEAENAVHAAEHQAFIEQSRAQFMQMMLRGGYTPEQAQQELDKHDQRVGNLRDAMQSAITNTTPTAAPATADTSRSESSSTGRDPEPPPDPTPEPAARTRYEPTADRDREPKMRMPVMPGAFSRALSSPGHWIKAFVLAALAGGVVFSLLAGLMHWMFNTAAFLTWPTGIIAAVIAVPAFLGVLSAASREVREWVRVGGPKPIQWR